jgi:threonine aldolase
MPKPVDLRSDTVTRPTSAMLRAMVEAELGDDVIDRDPTCEALQRETADLLGTEDAIFMPSGSMTNQIAIRIHCKPGDEFLCEAGCHVYNYEQAAFAQLGGVVARTIPGDHGVLAPEQLLGSVRPEADHLVRTRLVTLENTHNRGGGRVQPYGHVEAICGWAHAQGLRTHLDGARLFNAVVASGIEARAWAAHFDTVSVCYSKGLGAPVGSALAGPRDLIREARRHRKLFGGGMRQAGVLAAAALHALRHHRDRLGEDHAHARLLADAVRESPGLALEPDVVDTNIVIFRVDHPDGRRPQPDEATATAFVAALRDAGVLMLGMGPAHVRAVTHLDVDRPAVEQAAMAIRAVARERRGLAVVAG